MSGKARPDHHRGNPCQLCNVMPLQYHSSRQLIRITELASYVLPSIRQVHLPRSGLAKSHHAHPGRAYRDFSQHRHISSSIAAGNTMSNNAPDDIPVRTEEAWFTHSDGAKVYTKTWKTIGAPKARIVYLHGFSDHCNTCNPFFPILASSGVEIFGIDQRGWGQSVKSQKDRGVSGGTAQVMSDVSAYLRKFLPAFPEASSSPSDGVPTFLVGHSMGGQAVIYHAAHHPSPAVRGYIAMAPWIRLPSDVAPNKLKVISGQFAARFMPNFQVKQVVRAEMLSHGNFHLDSYLLL